MIAVFDVVARPPPGMWRASRTWLCELFNGSEPTLPD
jgi:hypothetical protein